MSSVDAADGSAGSVAAAGGWIGPAVAAVALIAIYLAPFLRDPGAIPPGLDTPGYVWRASAVYEGGLDALPSFRDRPGHPIVVSLLRTVTGATPLDLARAWPAVIAAAIGTAAFALARIGVLERSIASLAAAVGIADSAFVAMTAAAYASNLLVDVFIVAAVAVVLRVVVADDRRGAVAVIALTAAAAATHWLFAALLLVLLAVTALGAAVWPRDPGGRGEPRRIARTMALIVTASAVVGVTIVLLAPSRPGGFVNESFPGNAERRIDRRMPALDLGLTLPAAAAGGIALAALGGRRRRALPTLLAWGGIAPAGLIAWYALDLPLPPYRTSAAALGVPALIVLGSAAPSAWFEDRGRRAAAAVALSLAVGASAWLAVVGARTWWDEEPGVATTDLVQASILDAYLRVVPPPTVAVVPVPRGEPPPPRILRLGVDPARLERVVLVPADLSEGIETFVDDVVSRYPDGVAVVFLDAYRRAQPEAGSGIGPGVTVVHGPRPDDPIETPSLRSTGGELVRVAAIGFALLAVAGAGWTIALTRLAAADAVGLAPAVGAAFLVVIGLVWGRLGLRFDGGAGWTFVGLVAVGGWIVVVASRAIGARRDARSARATTGQAE